MKVVILAGGFGTRLSEYTDSIPKPMVPIANRPILEHIMMIYSKFGLNKFVVALGYKGEKIKNYFKNITQDWKIELVETGSETLTGGRIKKLSDYIGDETFCLTYGDGVSNINIGELIKFHNNHKKLLTVTAVRPPARFGSLEINTENSVTEFNEKIDKGDNWINGGFFVANPKILNFIKGDDTIFEKEPLEKLSQLGELKAYKHYGFWQCMDHKIDKENLEKLAKINPPIWLR